MPYRYFRVPDDMVTQNSDSDTQRSVSDHEQRADRNPVGQRSTRDKEGEWTLDFLQDIAWREGHVSFLCRWEDGPEGWSWNKATRHDFSKPANKGKLLALITRIFSNDPYRVFDRLVENYLDGTEAKDWRNLRDEALEQQKQIQAVKNENKQASARHKKSASKKKAQIENKPEEDPVGSKPDHGRRQAKTKSRSTVKSKITLKSSSDEVSGSPDRHSPGKKGVIANQQNKGTSQMSLNKKEQVVPIVLKAAPRSQIKFPCKVASSAPSTARSATVNKSNNKSKKPNAQPKADCSKTAKKSNKGGKTGDKSGKSGKKGK